MLGLPVGQHLDVQGLTHGGETVIKPYTPVSDDSRKGYVDFVIKAGAHRPGRGLPLPPRTG